MNTINITREQAELKDMKPIVSYNSVSSNFVYAFEKGYAIVCQVDKEWFMKLLRMRLGREINHFDNKYAIVIDDNIYYNHDGKIYLMKKI